MRLSVWQTDQHVRTRLRPTQRCTRFWFCMHSVPIILMIILTPIATSTLQVAGVKQNQIVYQGEWESQLNYDLLIPTALLPHANAILQDVDLANILYISSYERGLFKYDLSIKNLSLIIPYAGWGLGVQVGTVISSSLSQSIPSELMVSFVDRIYMVAMPTSVSPTFSLLLNGTLTFPNGAIQTIAVMNELMFISVGFFPIVYFKFHLYAYNRTSQYMQILFSGGDECSLAGLVPVPFTLDIDLQELLFACNYAIWSFNVTNIDAPPIQLSTTIKQEISQAIRDRDTNLIYFRTWECALYTLNTTTSNATLVVPSNSCSGGSLSYDAPSHRFVFGAGSGASRVWLITTDEVVPTLVASGIGADSILSDRVTGKIYIASTIDGVRVITGRTHTTLLTVRQCLGLKTAELSDVDHSIVVLCSDDLSVRRVTGFITSDSLLPADESGTPFDIAIRPGTLDIFILCSSAVFRSQNGSMAVPVIQLPDGSIPRDLQFVQNRLYLHIVENPGSVNHVYVCTNFDTFNLTEVLTHSSFFFTIQWTHLNGRDYLSVLNALWVRSSHDDSSVFVTVPIASCNSITWIDVNADANQLWITCTGGVSLQVQVLNGTDYQMMRQILIPPEDDQTVGFTPLLLNPQANLAYVQYRLLDQSARIGVIDLSTMDMFSVTSKHVQFQGVQKLLLAPLTSGAIVPCDSGELAAISHSFHCPIGSDYSSGTCMECLPEYATGTAPTLSGLQHCTRCPRGSVAPFSGTPNCAQCEPGSFQATGNQQICLFCDAGSFQPYSGQIGCPPCPPGRFSFTYGESECQLCPPGMYADRSGTITCIPCAKNTASNIYGRTDACPPCPSGSDQPATNQTECNRCDAGGFSQSGESCTTCLANSYPPALDAPCVTCDGEDQSGLLCSSGIPNSLEGWWAYKRFDNQSGYEVYATTPCPDGITYCPAAQLEDATTGNVTVAASPRCLAPRLDSSDNWLCGDCIADHIPWNSECVECKSANGALIFAMILFAFGLDLFLLQSSSSSAGEIAILLFFLQTAVLEIGPIASWLSWLQFINLSSSSVRRCLFPLTPLEQQALTFATPIILIVVLAIIAIIHLTLHLKFGNRSIPPASSSSWFRRQLYSVASQWSLDQYFGSLCAILLFCYTAITVSVARSLHCVTVAPGVNLLLSMPTISCDSDEYKRFQPVIITVLVVFVIGLPAAILGFLWHNRSKIHPPPGASWSPPSVDSPFSQRFGSLYRGYSSTAWFWSSWLLIRRFAFALTAVLVDNIQQRFVIFGLLNFTSILAHLRVNPFVTHQMNHAETGSYILLIYISGILAAVQPPYPIGLQVLLFLLVVPPGTVMLLWVVTLHVPMVRRWFTRAKLDDADEIVATTSTVLNNHAASDAHDHHDHAGMADMADVGPSWSSGNSDETMSGQEMHQIHSQAAV